MIRQQRIAELQAEVGEIGTRLAKLSFYDLRTLGNQFGSQLREAGMRMRLIESAHIELDGGISLDRVIKDVSECVATLSKLAEQLPAAGAVQHGVPS